MTCHFANIKKTLELQLNPFLLRIHAWLITISSGSIEIKSIFHADWAFIMSCISRAFKGVEKYLLIVNSKTLFTAQLIYHLRHTNDITTSIFNRHAEKSFSSVSCCRVNLPIKAFILKAKKKLSSIYKSW